MGEAELFAQADDKAEVLRQQALEDYALLDTEPEMQFDRIVHLASYIMGVPISLVSLIDASRQWFKARVGLGRTGDAAFHGVLRACDPNRRCDGRGKTRPSMSAFAAIPGDRRSQDTLYAGAPLHTKDGIISGRYA